MTPFDSFITFGATTDLAATSAFYGEVLGLPLVLDQGRCRIWRAARAGYVGFCLRDSVSTQGVILTLVSDDVDGWHRRLVDHGVPIEKAPALNPEYGIYHLFCRDPNGYLVEIQRFEDPNWRGSGI
ncbi:VOC family protein [Candidatus Fermentibacteria bacterium]|nr:VOC family protein [Candidatus Fermentibacteria bacterium]